MATGSISLLVDSPLRDLYLAMREVPTETKRQISRVTKQHGEPIWYEELKSRATTRIQFRALVDTRQTAFTARNITLRSGAGTRFHGGDTDKVVAGAEWGANAAKKIRQTRRGTTYERTLGPVFLPPRRGGYVFHPSAQASVPRFASLWYQTAARTLYDAAEGK